MGSVEGVSFAHLEVITKAIVTSMNVSNSQTGTIRIPLFPEDKMKKNNLTENVKSRLLYGMVMSEEVGKFIENSSMYNHSFADELKAGFMIKYKEFIEKGFYGDNLFFALCDFVSPPHKSFPEQAAGLAVLSHLFEKCDVFES